MNMEIYKVQIKDGIQTTYWRKKKELPLRFKPRGLFNKKEIWKMVKNIKKLRRVCLDEQIEIECYIKVDDLDTLEIKGFKKNRPFLTKEYKEGSYIGFEEPF